MRLGPAIGYVAERLAGDLVQNGVERVDHLLGTVVAHALESVGRVIYQGDRRLGKEAVILHVGHDRRNTGGAQRFQPREDRPLTSVGAGTSA